jgi:hypothetical protein
MRRTVNTNRSSDDPLSALVFLFVGVGSLSLAVLYPMQPLFAQMTPETLLTEGVLVVPAETLVIAAGLLVVSAAATTLGVLLLFLRL